MIKVENEEEYEEVLSSYYEGRGVSSLISLEIDTKEADGVAKDLADFDNVEDVLLVTGDVDLIVKARFKDYDHMKTFLTNEVSHFDGVEDVSSMMIVTTYKERGKLIEVEEDEEE
ncbi:MAG: Lrp/AsnC ligand binding domain-containing protein [Candidatus Thermoplasmatota archaeon]|nr:Lrp/AsnC ligand binding domain-containing protein [Candidatus Thermoplasmatota archaeon]